MPEMLIQCRTFGAAATWAAHVEYMCKCCSASRARSGRPWDSHTLFLYLCWINCVFVLLPSVLVTCQDIANYPNDDTNDKGLFPPTFNLASTALIKANATCGELGEDMFCKLVEHVREPQCGICDARSSNESRHYPITNAIDGTQKWWQSPSLQNGRQYEWVTITLDLQQVFQVAYVIVKAANSPRPGNWILERSLDGEEFKPWQYYAINDVECFEIYGIPPTIGIPRYRSDNEVICTSIYSKLEPLEHGEIHTSLVKGRPGVTGPSDKLQEFTAARYIRLRLQKIRTLHADLMTVTRRDWEKVYKSVTRRLFYSIKDISIGGQCMCFGHAKDCPADPNTGRLRCRCVHNTCGDSCEKCCPLYNQIPWRVGTSEIAGICAKCQCYGHAEECYYDKGVALRKESINIEGKYDGGGVCVNCRDFTAGNNCEHCIEGYYRPLRVLPDASQPCVKCICEGVGTAGHCVRDDSRLHEGLNPGDCICREGFAGPRCAHCAVGYRNFPVCDLCPCNFAGTVNTDCEGECICKPNVDGVRCDRCKPGHFNLDEFNPRGCTKCYCFGITSRCVSADLGVQVMAPRRGWLVSDILGQKVIRPYTDTETLAVANDDMTGYEAYYWLAPDNFTGNMLNAYGGRVFFNVSWVKARGDSAGWPTRGPNIILDGGGMLIGSEGNLTMSTDHVVGTVLLGEKGWFHLATDMVQQNRKVRKKDQMAVSRTEFMQVLFVLDRVLVRAKFNTDQIVGNLHTVSMEIGSESVSSLNRLRNVEKCQCPPGYSGLSCESCDPGYRRVNNTAHKGECRKCDCNNHVDKCDPYTGQCQDCLHNTTGEHCEWCKEGFYGYATWGTPYDCRRCACPLHDPRNQFSLTCTAVEPTDIDLIDYICTNCPIGYEGSKCERCADKFYGNPMVPGNYCQPCDCNNHLDPNVSGNCDSLTGECIRCTGNTIGWNCESCKDGFFGDALIGACEPCNCNPFGSANGGNCVKSTGQCECLARYMGLNCDRCIENYGNVAAGCLPCDCHSVGSESMVCDPVSGLCDCKPGVFGSSCDTCRDGYFDFSDNGCKWCDCHADGSRFLNCTLDFGQCWCLPNVRGRQCSECEEGFWNLQPGLGCESCSCNAIGSVGVGCDQNGQCTCKAGVGGLKCDRCISQYFGFSVNGCRACARCDVPGHICHPFTGECVCPPFTQGMFCEQCQPHTWGYESLDGCKPCNCSYDGSVRLQCDLDTGVCPCHEEFEGSHCNRCRFGFFEFPKCKKCKCHVDGTDPLKCRDDGHCECTEDGQCPCRTNVEGKKCRRCKAGTFGRTPIQREGCFKCFCFGKSVTCSHAEYTWTQLAHSDARELSKEVQDASITFINGLKVIPGILGNVGVGSISYLDAPLYWSLPPMFKGDKGLSYNGHLTFTVKSEGGSLFPESVLQTYPLVQLQGNFRIILEYYPEMQSPDGHYRVQLNENFWKIKNNHESVVRRETMMIALQNVQQLLIRATDRPDFTLSRLENVTLDTAIPAMPFSPVVAIGIEICTCPPEYNGTSCQDPADGFYRKRIPGWLNSEDIDLVGFAHPCECNGRSNRCDKETGVCLNCADNTDGHHCEKCATGFYGDPSLGQCLRCACPTVDNSFSDTCLLDEFGSVICTKCKEGYSGNRCQSCVHGYYGDPLLSGGSCQPCACDLRGSLGNMCDPQTGLCICLEGLRGRDCSQCTYRHVLTDYGCQSCDDECTGILLNDLDSTIGVISEVNLAGISTAPWAQLRSTNRTAVELRNQVNLYSESIKHGEMLIVDFSKTFDLKRISNTLFIKAKEFGQNASTVCESASKVRQSAVHIQNMTFALQKTINDTVKHLIEYARGVARVSVSIGAAIMEAEMKQMEINKSKPFFINAEGKAYREKKKTQQLLEKVKKLILKPNELRNLDNRRQQLETKLNDVLLNMLPRMNDNLRDVRFQNEDNSDRLENLKKLWEVVNLIASDIDSTIHDGGESINNANEFINEAAVNFMTLQQLLNKLLNATFCCDNTACYNEANCINKHNNYLIHLLPKYKLLVDEAVEHADNLTRIAMRILNKLFNSTRNEAGQAIKAVRAYQNIVDEINSARRVALEASAIANETHSKVFPSKGDGIENAANDSLKESKMLNSEADKLHTKSKTGLGNILIGINDSHQKLNVSNVNVEAKLKELKIATNSFPTGLAKIADELIMNISEINKISSDNKARGDKVEANTNATLWPRFREIEAASKKGVENLTTIVGKAEMKIELLKKNTTDMEKKRETIEKERNNMDRLIKKVTAQILQYRNRASSLINPVGGPCNCARRLRHSVKPSATNRITLQFSLANNESNSLLFFMGSTKHKDKALDFMAVEMVNRKMRFLWNAGKDTKMIEHPTLLGINKTPKNTGNNTTPDPLQSEIEGYPYNHFWYQVEIERTGNHAQLTVHCGDTSKCPNTVSVSGDSDPLHEHIDFGDEALFYIGGFPSDITPPNELVSRAYHGCMYNMKVDNKQVGFWNFISNNNCIGKHSCADCKKGLDSISVNGSSNDFTFDGDNSYAETIYEKSGRALIDTVYIIMKTYDENSLLAFFYWPDNIKRGYFSLHLADGHIVFSVKPENSDAYGILTIKSKNKHNTGKLKTVEAKYHRDRGGRLKITTDGDIEPQDISPVGHLPTSTPKYINLTKGFTCFLGGVSPTFTHVNGHNVSFLSFRGCMTSVQIGTTIVDFSKINKFGITEGCATQRINSFSTIGDGYINITGQDLKNGSSFGFTFQASEPNGILMASTFLNSSNPSNRHFYSLALNHGYMQFGLYERGINNITKPYLPVNASHYISVKLRNKEITIRINDSHIFTIKTTVPIDSPNEGGLFFGGVPDSIKNSVISKQQTNTNQSFNGIIRDAVFNHEYIPALKLPNIICERASFFLRQPKVIDFVINKGFKGVILGADQEITVASSPKPTMSQMTNKIIATPKCAIQRQINLAESGVKLGDSENSYINLDLQGLLNNRSFTISFDFRTFYPNGLLFAAKRGAIKKQHYFTMYLVNRNLELVIRDKRKKLVVNDGIDFSDGKWHTIYVTKKSKLLTVSHGKPSSGKTITVPIRLNVRGPLYMGSVPEMPTPRPSKQIPRIDQFRGCIKDFKADGLQKDLPPNSQNVGQCYLNVEAGSQFGGDAYVKYASKFVVGPKMDIELEFRTTEMEGVLLSVSERGNSPALALELYNGNVALSVDLGDGKVTREMVDFNGSSTYVCNNQWHVVKASYSTEYLSLRVDKNWPKYGSISATTVKEIRTKSPLYIGGLPDDEPKGALISPANFKGCIRNVVIQGKRKDWTDMEKRVRVQLNSCEVQ